MRLEVNCQWQSVCICDCFFVSFLSIPPSLLPPSYLSLSFLPSILLPCFFPSPFLPSFLPSIFLPCFFPSPFLPSFLPSPNPNTTTTTIWGEQFFHICFVFIINRFCKSPRTTVQIELKVHRLYFSSIALNSHIRQINLWLTVRSFYCSSPSKSVLRLTG